MRTRADGTYDLQCTHSNGADKSREEIRSAGTESSEVEFSFRLRVDSLLQHIQRHRFQVATQQSAELEPNERFARTLVTMDQIEERFCSDEHRSWLPMNREHIPYLGPLQLAKNRGKVLVQLAATDNSHG